VAIAAIAGYFALSGNPEKDTERFLEALKKSSQEAANAIWPEYNDRLEEMN
jgi:hypothetical protein